MRDYGISGAIWLLIKISNRYLPLFHASVELLFKIVAGRVRACVTPAKTGPCRIVIYEESGARGGCCASADTPTGAARIP